MQMQSIDEFIDGLLDEKGITGLEPDVRARLAADMKERLLHQIDREAILRLDETQAAELAERLDDPSFTSEEMARFIQTAGVDMSEVTLDTMLKFRNAYLGNEE